MKKAKEVYTQWAYITTGPDGRKYLHTCLNREVARIFARVDKSNGIQSRVHLVRIEVLK